MFDESRYKEAEMVATMAHKGQQYDIFPYNKHLQDVVDILKRFGYSEDYIVAGWLHDIIEDCNISYSKIQNVFGTNVAEIVYAVTDPKARNRKEKKRMVYQDIRNYPSSVIIKLADRIANTEHSKRMGNLDMFKMYQKEYDEFRKAIFISDQADEMWEYLKTVTSVDSDFTTNN